MAQPRHLSKAPITEAVIDFRASTPSELKAEAFVDLVAQIGTDYSPGEPINLFEFGWLQAPGKEFEHKHVDHGFIGFRYTSKDRLQIAQFRKDGFTFSRLAPYTRWEEVFREASRLYRLFAQIGRPEEITRNAVRYINRILLPEESVGDFSAYLTAPPSFPRGLDAFITGFLTQVQFQDPANAISGTVTQTIQQGASEPGKVPIILDLDIYEAGSKSPDPASILSRFEALRDVKNRYFFASITERTLDLFL
jgi:uncharacterized protein (TIGR04255 family)